MSTMMFGTSPVPTTGVKYFCVFLVPMVTDCRLSQRLPCPRRMSVDPSTTKGSTDLIRTGLDDWKLTKTATILGVKLFAEKDLEKDRIYMITTYYMHMYTTCPT